MITHVSDCSFCEDHSMNFYTGVLYSFLGLYFKVGHHFVVIITVFRACIIFSVQTAQKDKAADFGKLGNKRLNCEL